MSYAYAPRLKLHSWSLPIRIEVRELEELGRRFAEALAEDKVVVLDFTAEWCLNCKTLEATVLQTPDVVAAFDREDVVPMKIDLTGENPDGKAKLEEARRLTIPLLVVYGRQGEEIWKSDAYTPSQVLGAIVQADQTYGREDDSDQNKVAQGSRSSG